MISCKHAAELLSQARDTRLRWWEGLSLWLHLAGCALCRRFRRQSQLVEETGRAIGAESVVDENSGRLSEDARARIRRALRERI